MSKFASRIGLVSGLTLISRVLGLGRDMMTSALLGATVWNSAFITAFTLPNLFRRLLGEGALTAALMPNLSEELASRGRAAVHELVNKTLSWLALICVALTGLAIAALELAKHATESEKWILAAELGQILFPYILLVCAAAVLAAALNLFSRFAVPALTAVWLNLSIMAALGFAGWQLGGDLATKTYWLCGGTLLGGLLQLIVPIWALQREGWRPKIDFGLSPRLREVALLTLPGIFGAAIFQINTMVSRGLAFAVSDAAASLLYYANRLVELPIGVFAIAISTVVFPALTSAIAAGHLAVFADMYRRGILLCLLLAVPSAAGLIVLAEPIVALLFERGMFSGADTLATAPLVIVFAAGMPFYAFVSVETRAFFALKDTKTPVRVAAVAFAVNMVLSFALMGRCGAVGLAIASNAAAVAQAILLHVALKRKGMDTSLRPIGSDTLRVVVASLAMAGAVYAGNTALQGRVSEGLLADALPVAVLIPVGAATYFATLRLTGLNAKRLLR